MEKIKINLSKFLKTSDSDYLSGRDYAREARKKENLDTLDKNNTQIEIIIPNNLIGINISFFLGMFSKSIKKLGEAKFREKYSFVYSKETLGLVKPDIERGIKEALDERTPRDILFGLNK